MLELYQRDGKYPKRNIVNGLKSGIGFALGEIQLVEVEHNLWVANMIAQHKIYKDENGNAPIRYEAVNDCLLKLALEAQRLNASIHMPRIGCGLAGGSWDRIEPLINEQLVEKNTQVFVYDFS